MSSLDELAFLDATAQADLVRRNEVAPLELVSGCADVRSRPDADSLRYVTMASTSAMDNQGGAPSLGPSKSSPEDRLDSWKEIATYLRREVRTVQRWEISARLPVHRLQIERQSAVYAYKSELDAWYRDRRRDLERNGAASKENERLRTHWTVLMWSLAFGAAAFVLVLALNSGGMRDHLYGKATTPRIASLVVIPLENLSRDADQEYFSDGMTDALITDLAQIGSLKVISRASSMQYKQSKKSAPEIARELKVDAIVEGTVQRSGDRVRITAQLVHGPSDKHIWANSYERELRDTLQLQGEVAHDIAERISASLVGAPGRHPVSAYALNPEALR